jgi:hypothetical protein
VQQEGKGSFFSILYSPYYTFFSTTLNACGLCSVQSIKKKKKTHKKQRQTFTMSSNSFQGSGPDISSLLSMIQGGGPQNGGGQQQQQQQQQNQQLGGMQNSVGNYVHNNGGGSDPSAMSSLLQGLLGIGQQQQRNPRNGLNDVLSLLSAQQQLGQSGSGCQGVDLARLAASGLLGNLQQGGDHQSGQSQNLANFLGSQGNQSNQTQEQALALARMAGARLLSGDDTRGDPSRDANEAAKANLNRQTRGMESDNSSPFFAHRRNLIADTAADSARGRNLEPGAVAVPCRARGMPMDHNPLVRTDNLNATIDFFQLQSNVSPSSSLTTTDRLLCYQQLHPAWRRRGVLPPSLQKRWY